MLLRLIAIGYDIWIKYADTQLHVFANLYRNHYYALSTISQFMERSVKESACISLGWCSESNISTISIICAHLIPGNIAKDKDVVKRYNGEKRSVQGNVQTKVLIQKSVNHSTMINKIRTNNDKYTPTDKILSMI